MNYTDNQLKQALEKMLPETLMYSKHIVEDDSSPSFIWLETGIPILNTELPHLCWLVEEMLTIDEGKQFTDYLWIIVAHYKCTSYSNDAAFLLAHATWQQRTTALVKVLNIEITL